MSERPDRIFPMMVGHAPGPSIPWYLAERIYQLYGDLHGRDQSLETMAKRGGFGWDEVEHICEEWQKEFGREAFLKLVKGWDAPIGSSLAAGGC